MIEGSSRRHAREEGSAATERQAHAVLDLPSRRNKGLKIERLLDMAHRHQPMRLLEIGTGSGGIAHYFGTHPHLRCEVDAVDVSDSRMIAEGYRYHEVIGTELPFDDESFDVVLSNHVIEHVGDTAAQLAHLRELHRVLRQNGVGYLAVPNRWMLVEPHYRLAFLSWLPRTWRSSYLRLRGRGEYYDCEPLQMEQLERMLNATNFSHRNLCVEAWRATLDIERPHSISTHVLGAIPDTLLMPLRRVIPTLIYQLSRA